MYSYKIINIKQTLHCVVYYFNDECSKRLIIIVLYNNNLMLEYSVQRTHVYIVYIIYSFICILRTYILLPLYLGFITVKSLRATRENRY